MQKGILYGISTGPGDPELMTIKAWRILQQIHVIAAPRTRGTNSMALDIVKEMMDLSDKEICYLDFIMTKDMDVLRATRIKQAEQIEKYLEQGVDVAMLNIGDASLYGTFCYVRDILVERGYEAITVPGVTSFCAAAAVLGQSLTTREQPLTILPGTHMTLDEELDRPGTKVIMKSGRTLSQIKGILEEKGLTAQTSMAVNCGLPDERIYTDIRQSREEEGYFATLLVHDRTD